MSLFWKLVSLPILVVSTFGCTTQHSASYAGWLDLVMRPDNAEVSGRRTEGSFAVQTQEGRTVDRLMVVNPYDTLSVALPEGSYLLEWQPVLEFQSQQEAAARAGSISAVGTPFNILAERVTTVHARVVVTRDADPELAALTRDIPSVEILISRH